MNVKKIIDGLQFTISMILFNPFTGESKTPDQLNEDDRITYDACMSAIEVLRAQEPITGETSDGYHTFNELYHHRAVLFSVIVANYPDKAWKSKKHHDGTMYDGMFIVGIDTPDGQATYHYDIDPYWDMFKCRVLDNAPEWDGHTPAQAIERIGKLEAQEPRVMTLEEVAGCVALERETPFYMEYGYLATHAGQVIELIPKYMWFDDEHGLSWDVCEGGRPREKGRGKPV